VRDALALVQLGPFEERLPAELSGGQQQRVALARALVIEPSVLLLDEPLGALDKGLRESMQVELRQLQQRLGITSVIVTHDQEEALTLSDRIVVMRAGRLEQVGTPQEIYARPVSRFVAGFIGASNFLYGRVVARETDAALIELAGGMRVTVPGVHLAPGQNVSLAVRPEAISVAPADEPGLPATVAQVIYRGAVTHIYLKLDDGAELVAHQQNRGAGSAGLTLERGHRVVARWADDGNHLLLEP
jgi:ABC-type Fe3+/spermidine/putrescine transport system ATPase subunit